MNLSAREIAKHVNNDGKEPKKSGPGYVMRCPVPAHGVDKNYSGWIADGHHGVPGVKCFKSCSKREVRDELKRLGLWPEIKKKSSTDKGLRLNGIYDFKNPDGKVILKIKLFDPIDGGRKIPVPYIPDGSGDFEKSTGKKKLPNILYNLPGIIAASKAGKVIFDVEGEPKAQLLIDLKLHATTIFGGSNNIEKWAAAEPNVYCKGAQFVVVIPDHDQPGFKLAIQKCRFYHKHGIPVKFFTFKEFGDVRESGGLDVKDWFEGGKGTKDEFVQRVLETPLWEPDPEDDGFGDLFEPGNLPAEGKVIPVRPKDEISPFSELATARKFQEDHSGNVVFVPEFQSWYFWNGKYWEEDKRGHVRELMADSIAKQFEMLSQIPGLDRPMVDRWHKKADGKNWISNSLYLAQPRMTFDYLRFDADPWILNCKNGIVNLKNGELMPHDKDKHCSLMIPHEYKGLEYDDCPMWWQTLEFAFPGNGVMWNFLARIAGYSATGLQSEKRFFLLYGPKGDNMKSTLTDGIRYALGPYANSADKRLIIQVPNENKYSDPSQLLGLRMAVLDEIFNKDRIDNGKFRKIVSGGDAIKGSKVFKDTFDINPIVTLWGFGNEFAKLDSKENQASWDRMVPIPCRHRVPADKLDRNFREKLKRSKRDLEGILSWIVNGCLEYQQIGLSEPDEVTDARTEYRDEMDPAKSFFTDCTVSGPGFFELFSNLYKVYYSQSLEDNKRPLSQKSFGTELRLRGFEPRLGLFREPNLSRLTAKA